MRPVKALKLDSLLSAGDVARKEVPRIVVTPSLQPLMALVIPICLLIEEKTGSGRTVTRGKTRGKINRMIYSNFHSSPRTVPYQRRQINVSIV